MTRESLRIAESIDTQFVLQNLTISGAVQVLPANAGRIAVTVTDADGGWGLVTDTLVIGVGSADNFSALGAISPGMPSLRIRIEDVGSVLRGPIVIANKSGSVAQVVVADHFLTRALGDM